MLMVPLPTVVGAPNALAPPLTFCNVLMLTSPFKMVVVPIYVLKPPKVNVPVPIFTIFPVPLMTPS